MNISPDKFWELEMRNQQARNQLQQQAISSAISSVAGMYSQYNQGKNQSEALTQTVGAMKDKGIITQDELDKFMNIPKNQQPIVFENYFKPQMSAWTSGQAASAQAAGWDAYKSKWGAGGNSAPSSANNKYGYVYQGP